MACTPDVWRLCSDQIPDAGRITSCLRQNTPSLSGNCRAVFESNAQQDTAQATPRARSAPSPRQQYQQPQYRQPAQPQYRPPNPDIDDDND